MAIETGRPAPLGATWDGAGVNFALFSDDAEAVDLCLFDAPDASTERTRLRLPSRTGSVFHGYVPDLGPGQLYGYRVYGPWSPSQGLRFNPAKVVFDPYARDVGRVPRWHTSLFGYAPGTEGLGAADPADSAPYAPLAAVVDSTDPWPDDRPPRTPWRDTVIYELHVKGFSMLNPAVPPVWRGTYLGVSAPASIEHLRALGVTAVELLPIHAHADEWALFQRGLTNYWGYNTLAYFAPDPRFATSPARGAAVREFRQMVAALHAAGLEVLLDVVYNHTAESDRLGPTLSMRGINNRAYYRLHAERPGDDEDFTGCGNTLDLRRPHVRRLVLDSLRYWVAEMHVDGFRFDLAPALARDPITPDRLVEIFGAIEDDPVLGRVKLIAEPWDAAPGGYQLGNFPAAWSEWNDQYRNTVRRFWRGDRGVVGDLATRLAGSRDLFGHDGRSPRASVNYVTSHDGFTLADVVAYNDKHNEANGEANRDGESRNLSWNGGVEGPTEDAGVRALRDRQRRNFLFTLVVSLGTPMVNGGDELGRTQSGNNNGYCHDSPLSWTPWPADADSRRFLAFARRALALRASQLALRRDAFLDGPSPDGPGDVVWRRPDGAEMTDADWQDADRRVLGVALDGLFIVFNASDADVTFELPARGAPWRRLLDTADPDAPAAEVSAPTWTCAARAAAVFGP
ncbi:MAG TPA: glycogen debranching protein GlgX [Vicinamibacterales bacterium]|nr:glycogen debranching protein GlgX [Vicinamibacterales bacterium]